MQSYILVEIYPLMREMGFWPQWGYMSGFGYYSLLEWVQGSVTIVFLNGNAEEFRSYEKKIGMERILLQHSQLILWAHSEPQILYWPIVKNHFEC